MRIKDYKRLSLAGMAVSAVAAIAGIALMAAGSSAGVFVLILGVAGFILSSTAIRLYGKMSMAAFFKGEKLEKD